MAESLEERNSSNETPSEILRPVFSAYTLELGTKSVCDTYLSPLKYKGWAAAINYERMQAMKFNPDDYLMQLTGRVEFSRGLNPAHTAYMLGFEAKFGWSMMRRFNLPVPGLILAVGGATDLSAGVFYKSFTGNNPASAKAAWTVNLTGSASWVTRLGKLPLVLRYQPQLPLLGLFFSPQYDELYYEIYLGNHGRLVHFAYPGNRFAMDNYVTADLSLGSTNLRLGYRCDILSSKANGLVTNVIGHMFVIGLSGEWISLNPSRNISEKTKTISAIY